VAEAKRLGAVTIGICAVWALRTLRRMPGVTLRLRGA